MSSEIRLLKVDKASILNFHEIPMFRTKGFHWTSREFDLISDLEETYLRVQMELEEVLWCQDEARLPTVMAQFQASLPSHQIDAEVDAERRRQSEQAGVCVAYMLSDTITDLKAPCGAATPAPHFVVWRLRFGWTF